MFTRHRRTIRHLRELIAALDRRLPQTRREGEAAIVREAAGLRGHAVQRIAELEREMAERLAPKCCAAPSSL